MNAIVIVQEFVVSRNGNCSTQIIRRRRYRVSIRFQSPHEHCVWVYQTLARGLVELQEQKRSLMCVQV